MAVTPLFPEAQAVQVAVALANLPLAHTIKRAAAWRPKVKDNPRCAGSRDYYGTHDDPEEALAKVEAACAELVDSDTLSETGADQWLAWGRQVREWLLVARRQKYGVRLHKHDPRRSALPAFPPRTDALDSEGVAWDWRWAKDTEDRWRERWRDAQRFDSASIRAMRVAAEITEELTNLKPFYLLFCWQEDSRLTVHRHGIVKPITPAAFGAALLLDSSAGYSGSTGEFYSYKSRFGMCQRPGCRKFYCFGSGTKGADHKHCSPACAVSHRVWAFRYLTAEQKANRARLKEKNLPPMDAPTRMGRLAQVHSGEVLGQISGSVRDQTFTPRRTRRRASKGKTQ
jgi:hypothetical protein